MKTRITLALAFSLLPVCGRVSAHWEEHEHLPRWAQRGVMRSCVCPFDAQQLRPWLDTDPLACHFNVVFTDQTAWEDPRTPTRQLIDGYFQPRDAHLFFYTCPNSIYWDDEFERAGWRDDLAFERYRMDNFHRYPYAKDCVNVDRNGRPTVAYPWPSRRHRTSYFADQWVEHHKQIMSYMIKGKEAVRSAPLREAMHGLKFPGIVDGFYFDNAGQRQDWGPLAMARWKAISEAQFGRFIDPRTAQDPRTRAYWQDMQFRAYIDYHNAFRRHGWTFDPPRLTLLGTHGPYGYYGAAADFPDIEFYENTYHVQPQGDNIWDMKCGLARTHGKAQACLNHERFRPTKLNADGDFEVLNWTLTREFARLSMAEGMALGGNHMVQIGPLTYPHLRYADEYVLYNGFAKQLEEEIYHNSRPAARLAVLWSSASEARGAGESAPLGKRLWTAGIPFDVIVEHDLEAKVWKAMAFDLLIMPDVRCLNEERVRTVLEWVQQGGSCLISQSLAERNELGLPQESPSARMLLGDTPRRWRYTPAIDFVLQGYEPERDGRIWLPATQHFAEKTPEGTATVTFDGPTGAYDVAFQYLDEDDGRSTLTVCKNQEQLLQFRLEHPSGNPKLTQTLKNVPLQSGDEIRIHALLDGDEFCRIYNLEITPTGVDLRTLRHRSIGRGRVAFAPADLMEYDTAEFLQELTAVAGGALDQCVRERHEGEMGDIFCNLMRDRQNRGLQVHVVNTIHQTPERYTPLRDTKHVCQVDVALDELPRKPVVRLLAWGTGRDWQLAVDVNGTQLDPVDAAGVKGKRWLDLPVPLAVLKANARNRVAVRIAGRPNTYNAHAALYIDSAAEEPHSAFSIDNGATFADDDLSMLNGVQSGAFAVHIVEARPPAPRPPDMPVRLVPQERVNVRLDATLVSDTAQALVISPDLPPVRIPLKREAETVTVAVPRLEIYSVVVLSEDAGYLAAVEAKADLIRHEPLPPRTPEFTALLRSGAVGEKLKWGNLEGDIRLRGVASIDPATVSARNDSRAHGVDLKPEDDFAVTPDGQLSIQPPCRTLDSCIYLTWTDIDGGHYRERYAPYTSYGDGQLAPPGWRLRSQSLTRVYRETGKPNVHEGLASVRIVAKPRGGISSASMTTDPGRSYRLSVWLKVAKGKVQLAVINGADAEPVNCNSSEWEEVELHFVATGHRVDVSITGTRDHDESVFYADAASLREMP